MPKLRYLRVNEPLEDGELFAFRNCDEMNDFGRLKHVGGRHLEVDVVDSVVVRLEQDRSFYY